MEHFAEAEAKPKQATEGSLPLCSPPLSFPLSSVVQFFSGEKNSWFITMRDNSQRAVKMDYFRKKIATFYDHYVLVRSPKNGWHFHALVSGRRRAGHVVLKKGYHVKVSRLGYKAQSTKNIARGNPLDGSGDVLTELQSHLRGKVAPVKSALPRKPRAQHVIDVVMYLINNLLENESHDRYNTLSIRL